MIRNVLFIVEGKTEGLANVFGKGIYNIIALFLLIARNHAARSTTDKDGCKSVVLRI